MPSIAGTPTVNEANANGTTTIVATVPTGVTEGERLLLAVIHSSSSLPGAQSGWTTLVGAQTVGGHSVRLYERVATASEPASYTVTGLVSNLRVTTFMARVTGVLTADPYDVSLADSALTVGSSAVGSSLVFPTVSTASNSALVINVVGLNAASATSPLLVPPATDTVPGALGVSPSTSTTCTSSGTGRRASLSIEQRPTAGALGTRTWTKTGATDTQFCGVRIIYKDSGATPVAPTPVLTHRIVGIPTTTTARVSAQATDATSMRIKVGTDSGVSTGVLYGSATTPNSQDVAHMTITGLTAATQYYYRVEMTDSDGGLHLDAATTVGSFRTAPSGQTSFNFCFGSCSNQADPDVFANIAARRATDDLFLHLGDLYYADDTGTDVANFRTRMQSRIQGTDFQSIVATMPTSYTPSDHDGLTNDQNAGADPTAWTNWNQAYREFFPLPTLPGGSTGAYYTFTWGRVRFIQIDTRSFASTPSATDNASKTMLGSAQKQWLKDRIDDSTEPLILILQDNPWIMVATSGNNGWSGFTTERAELGAYFAASGKHIGMLAGDMHALAADDGTNAVGGIFVLHASPFYNSSSLKGGPYSQSTYPTTNGVTATQQYGRCVVTDSGTQISIAFTGYDLTDTARVTLTKTFDVAATPDPEPEPDPAVLTPGGGWWDLATILADSRQLARTQATQRLVACLDCGGPLETGPRNQLFCRFDGRRY